LPNIIRGTCYVYVTQSVGHCLALAEKYPQSIGFYSVSQSNRISVQHSTIRLWYCWWSNSVIVTLTHWILGI